MPYQGCATRQVTAAQIGRRACRSRHRRLIDQLAAEHLKISRMINAANRFAPFEIVDRGAVANAAGFCDLYLLKPNIEVGCRTEWQIVLPRTEIPLMILSTIRRLLLCRSN
jgi:hypothetical protein